MNLKQQYKKYLFEKQKGKCCWCRNPMQMHTPYRGPNKHGKSQFRQCKSYATFEHVRLRSNGNKFDADRLAHYKCNLKHNARYQAEFGSALNRYYEVRKRFEKLRVTGGIELAVVS